MSEAGQQAEAIHDLPPPDDPQAMVVGDDEDHGAALSPEDAIRDARAVVTREEKQAEAEAQRLRDEATRARTDAANARQNETAAVQARFAERGTAIANGIEAAKAQKTSAAQAYKAARESGDVDAEIRAQESLADAAFRLGQFESAKRAYDAEAERLKTAGPQPREDQSRAADYSPAEKEWISRNPKFNTDGAFRSSMIDAHYRAVQEGAVIDSPLYFQRLDEAAARYDQLFGEKKPQETHVSANGQQQPARTQRQSSSTAAPVARDTVSGSRSGFTINTGAHGETLTLYKDREGKDAVRGTIPADWVQAASWSKMKPVDYAISQMQIQKEMQEGGPAAGLNARINGSYK